MSSRGKRKNAPKKFVDKPGIPDDVESEESANEESFSSENEEEDVYESNEENSSTSSEEEEQVPSPKRKSKITSKVKQEPAKPVEKKKLATASENGERSFKILVESIIPEDDTPRPKEKLLKSDGGKFTGKNPMQAAKKAFNRICRSAFCECSKENKCQTNKGCKCTYKESCIYIFKIQETTLESAQKVFHYRGKRIRLDEPQEVPRKDIVYFVYYSSNVKSYKPDIEDTSRQSLPPGTTTKPAKKSSTVKPSVKKERTKKVVDEKGPEKKFAPRGRKSQQKTKA